MGQQVAQLHDVVLMVVVVVVAAVAAAAVVHYNICCYMLMCLFKKQAFLCKHTGYVSWRCY